MNKEDSILVTGGAGFIGSNFVLSWIKDIGSPVINLDSLTYAGNRSNLQSLDQDSRHIFVHGDMADEQLVTKLLREYRPRAVVHFAAESHVDRSIVGPGAFIQTNVVGTFELLQTARAYYAELSADEKKKFRFLHVSTDEVYGTLGPDDPAFSETTAYAPNSPYAASKAASDHLVRAYFHTYGLPVLTTNCSNNYGPYQFPEKLVPLAILRALVGEPVPVYGDGLNVRDWIHVEDHCAAVFDVLMQGRAGEIYNVGANAESKNLDLVRTILAHLGKGEELIEFVRDRPGHDRRYAIDSSKIRAEIGWKPLHNLDRGLAETIEWYRQNESWWREVQRSR